MSLPSTVHVFHRPDHCIALAFAGAVTLNPCPAIVIFCPLFHVNAQGLRSCGLSLPSPLLEQKEKAMSKAKTTGLPQKTQRWPSGRKLSASNLRNRNGRVIGWEAK